MKIVTDEDAIWRALAEPIRREIIDLLAVGPRTTGELVSHFDSLCRTGVMKHLAVLVSANLVLVQKSGRTRWNHLNPVPIEQVCQRWVDGHVKRLSKSMTRLKFLDLVGYINAKYGGPATTMLNATLTEDGTNRTVLRISDSLYGRVSDGLVNSLNTGWQMLFNDGLKPFVEASQ